MIHRKGEKMQQLPVGQYISPGWTETPCCKNPPAEFDLVDSIGDRHVLVVQPDHILGDGRVMATLSPDLAEVFGTNAPRRPVPIVLAQQRDGDYVIQPVVKSACDGLFRFRTWERGCFIWDLMSR